MSRRLTQEKVIEGFRRAHGNRYDYSNSVYLGVKKKIAVACREHGEFWIRPDSHSRGSGCRKCGELKPSLRKTIEDVQREIRTLRPSLTIPNQDYLNNESPLSVTCSEHGLFRQSFNRLNLKNGKGGCVECNLERLREGRMDSLKTVIEKFTLIHSENYDYSLIQEYDGHESEVEVICNSCKSRFNIACKYHMMGTGCPFCTKAFSRSRPCNLYLVRIRSINSGDVYIKAGVSRKHPSRRFLYKNPELLDVIRLIRYPSGRKAKSLEGKILKALKKKFNHSGELFDGRTESFYEGDSGFEMIAEFDNIAVSN